MTYGTPGRSGIRVLMADDDPQIRQLNRRLLAEEGFDVVEAADGVEALEQLERRPAAVAVIDLRMPRLDGYALSEVVAARWPGTAMIFITAHPDYDRCQSLPGPLLIKPYYLAELVSLVHRLADDHRLRVGEPAGRGPGRRAADWWPHGH